MVALRGCAWIPVEQEGRVSILGDRCGSDEDMEAQRGNGLAWGWQGWRTVSPRVGWTVLGAQHTAHQVLWPRQPARCSGLTVWQGAACGRL